MKHFFTALMILSFFTSCHSKQSEAKQLAENIQSAVKENTPGGIATKEGGWTMTAKINGKDFTAASLMPPEAAGRIIGSYNNESISLPYDRRDMVAGHKNKFGESNAVDIFTNDDVGIWGGRKGEMEITKVDGDWVEGKFFVTGSTSRSEKTVEVTDGFFRISLAKKQ